MESNLIGYLDRKTWIHQLSGAAKLICFLLLSVIGMISYDTRFLLDWHCFRSFYLPVLEFATEISLLY